MGNVNCCPKRKSDNEESFYAAVASSLGLRWLGTHDTEAEMRVCKHALLPLLLNYAAKCGEVDKLKALIGEGADISGGDWHGRTPLHLAAKKGSLSVVNFLLEAGADVNKVDAAGKTPLQEAVSSKNVDVVRRLVSKGAYLMMTSEELGAQMCCLANQGLCEDMLLWKAAGVSFNVADDTGRTPLHVVASSNNPDMVGFCIQNGSDLEARDMHSNKPIDDAMRLGYWNIKEMLTKKSEQQTEA